MIPDLIAPPGTTGGHIDATSPAGVQPDGQPSGWTLTMSEEFNGDDIIDVDTDQGWIRFRDGGTIWRTWHEDYIYTLMNGNIHTANRTLPERQYYDRDSFTLDGAGSLVITAAEQPEAKYVARSTLNPELDNVFRYTSGLMQSNPSFSQTFGFFEARMKLPGGPVQWPAFWLFPNVWDTTRQVELDIMECFAQNVQVHHSNQMPGKTVHMASTHVGDVTAWHTYGMAWSPESVDFYVDGVLSVSETNAAAIPAQPMYPILNLATRPTSGTYPPVMTMLTDYIRVWQAA